jgi:hypothetical protein
VLKDDERVYGRPVVPCIRHRAIVTKSSQRWHWRFIG